MSALIYFTTASAFPLKIHGRAFCVCLQAQAIEAISTCAAASSRLAQASSHVKAMPSLETSSKVSLQSPSCLQHLLQDSVAGQEQNLMIVKLIKTSEYCCLIICKGILSCPDIY